MRIFQVQLEGLSKTWIACGCALISLAAVGWWLLYCGYPSPDYGRWPDHPDRAIWMDAGWRMLQGQVPHRDFVTPIGAAWLYVNALPFWLWGPSYPVMPRAVVLAMAVLGCGIFALVYRRSQSRIAALSAVWVMIAVNINAWFLDYNVLAYCLVMFVWLEVISPPEHSWKNWAWLSGGILAVLFFWKLNFAAVALVLAMASAVMFKKNTYWFGALALGFVVMTLLLIAGIHGHMGRMIQDIQIPLMVKKDFMTNTVLNHDLLWKAIRHAWGWTVFMGLGFMMAWRCASPRWSWLRPAFMGGLVGLGLILVQAELCVSNAARWEAYAAPLMGLAALMWLGMGRNFEHSIFSKRPKIALLFMVFVAMLMTAYSWTRVFRDGAAKRCHRDLRQTSSMDQPMNYSASVADGLRLLEQRGARGRRVLCMGYSNPFPVLLRSPSVKHDLLWWFHLDSFNKTHHPDIQTILDGTDIVMQPKWCLNDSCKDAYMLKWQLFESEVGAHFQLLAESPYWKAWGRR